MSAFRALSEINPALIVAVAAVAYALIWWTRRYTKSAVAITLLLCGVLLAATPSGRDTIDLAAQQDKPVDRARCLAAAILDGAPLDRGAAARNPHCRKPSRIGNPTPAGERTFKRNAADLKDRYR